MARLRKAHWTLVRHTGYSVGANMQFYRAVEERSVTTQGQAAKVMDNGGVRRIYDGVGGNRQQHRRGTPNRQSTRKGEDIVVRNRAQTHTGIQYRFDQVP